MVAAVYLFVLQIVFHAFPVHAETTEGPSGGGVDDDTTEGLGTAKTIAAALAAAAGYSSAAGNDFGP